MNENSETKTFSKQSSKLIIKRLIDYIHDYRLSIVVVFFLSLVSAFITIISPKISGEVITKLSESTILKNSGSSKYIDFDGVFQTLAFLFVLGSIFALTSCACSYIITGISLKITYRLREDISKKISVIPMSYLEKKNCGEILSYVSNDVEILSSSIAGSISQIISSVVMFFGIMYMMFSISWQMSVISIGVLPIASIFMSVIASRSQKFFKKFQDDLGAINGHIEEMYSGHEIVKSFNMEDASIKKFDSLNENMYESSWKSEFLSGFMSPIMGIASNINYIAVCIMGGYLASLGNISIGDISAFIAYSGQFMGPLTQIANTSSVIQQTIASAQRIFEFIDAEEELDCAPEAKVLEEKMRKNITIEISSSPSITFENVNFGYEKNNLVIEDFSLEIPSGKTVAIVGHTGAGKSTLIKILLNFYKINSGKILIGNTDIYEYKNKKLRSLFGVVLQDTWLYSGSILENIKYSNKKISDEKVIDICKTTGLDHFISTLPYSYNTLINESLNNMSQGQKQLISIARALVSEPKILILDEATSSVDTATEEHIQKSIKNILNSRTSLIIAHRLSTIKDADIIVTMDKGRIVEKGTHHELLKNKSHYYNLYINQFAKGLPI